MITCMFCNEKLLILSAFSAVNTLIHDKYKACSFNIKDVIYNVEIFQHSYFDKITRSEYFYYNNIRFYFDYNDAYIKLIFDKDTYGSKILDVEFLRESFNINFVDKALDRFIDNLIFI